MPRKNTETVNLLESLGFTILEKSVLNQASVLNFWVLSQIL